MKIVVVSDNHGLEKPLEDVRRKHSDIQVLVHLGDSEFELAKLKGFIAVKGNNDFYPGYQRARIIEVNEHRILIIHGDGLFYGQNRDGLVATAKDNDCDIVLFGHSHVFEHQIIDGITLINPGSLNYNRDFSNPCYAIVDIEIDSVNVTRVDI